MHAKSTRHGLTVLELLVVLLVTGVLAGALSLVFDRDRAELSRATEDLRARVLSARYEAIKRNRAVFVSVETDRLVLRRDDPPNGRHDPEDPVVLTLDRADYAGLLALESSAVGGTFGWSPEGMPRAADGAGALGTDVHLRLVSRGERQRCLKLEPGGRLMSVDPCGRGRE